MRRDDRRTPGTSAIAILGLSLASSAAPAATIFTDDFTGGVASSQWSTSMTETSPLGEEFLGRFWLDGGIVTLDLGSVGPAHVLLTFDVYVTGSWDGNDPPNGPERTLRLAAPVTSNAAADALSTPGIGGRSLITRRGSSGVGGRGRGAPYRFTAPLSSRKRAMPRTFSSRHCS